MSQIAAQTPYQCKGKIVKISDLPQEANSFMLSILKKLFEENIHDNLLFSKAAHSLEFSAQHECRTLLNNYKHGVTTFTEETQECINAYKDGYEEAIYVDALAGWNNHNNCYSITISEFSGNNSELSM